MKTKIVKSIALASILAIAAISNAQAKTYAAGSQHYTCYYHNGHKECTSHYSTNPYTYNGNKKQYCGYHTGGSYTCYQPSGIHHYPNNCAPGMLCK